MKTASERPTREMTPPARGRTDDWVWLEAICGETAKPGPARERLLAWNAALGGGAKFVLTAEQQVRVRAEWPGGDDRVALESPVLAAAAIARARQMWRGVDGPSALIPLPRSLEPGSEWRAACAESGWEVVPRAEGGLTARLEVRDGRWAAQFAYAPPAGTLAWVEIARLDGVPEEAREAIATVLLLAGGALRWARPAVRAGADGPVAVFELLLACLPRSADIADALSVLSIACRLGAAEAAALRDGALAGRFRQVLSPDFPPPAKPEKKEESHGPAHHP